jgi:microsomal dipeptidase-like Zn-dependent dipeptidase
MRIKSRLAWLLAAVLILAVAAFVAFPTAADVYLNATTRASSAPPSARARQLHGRLRIADLHADTLLWDRDLLAGSRLGHVDLPRLQEGNVALQAFTVVTKVPRRISIERNSDDSDLISLLALTSFWPTRAWASLKQRALYQSSRLEQAARRSKGMLRLIRTADDLDGFLKQRQRSPAPVAGWLGLEGAHALEGDPANVDVLFEAGFRMISPSHFFDTEMGGSAAGVAKGGLTPAGSEMLRRMERRGMLVDLAHASERTIEDVLALATRPVVVSHTGVRGACDNNRNLRDDHARRIAAAGGVIGIGFWRTAVCGESPRDIARSIRYAAGLVGVDHVALGSDFDGATTTPFDAAGLVRLTDALLAEGFSGDDIRKIMGENVIRLLMMALPRSQ